MTGGNWYVPDVEIERKRGSCADVQFHLNNSVASRLAGETVVTTS